MEMFLESIVRGYHVYRRIWEAVVGEELTCITEPDNRSDRYAVAVIKSDTTVGHVGINFGDFYKFSKPPNFILRQINPLYGISPAVHQRLPWRSPTHHGIT